MIRIASIQIDPVIGKTDAGPDLISREIERVGGAGAWLAFLPECALTGYLYSRLDKALEEAGGDPSRRA